MLSNSSGLLRYGPETVLTGLERFLPPVWAFNLAGDSRKFASTSHLDFLCACSICRNFGRKNAHCRHKKLPSFFSTDIWAFLIAFWVFTIALVVFVHVPVLLRSNFYILRADLKCAILETGRNITERYLRVLVRPTFQGSSQRRSYGRLFRGGRHMTLP